MIFQPIRQGAERWLRVLPFRTVRGGHPRSKRSGFHARSAAYVSAGAHLPDALRLGLELLIAGHSTGNSDRLIGVIDGHRTAEQVDDADVCEIQFAHFFGHGQLRRVML